MTLFFSFSAITLACRPGVASSSDNFSCSFLSACVAFFRLLRAFLTSWRSRTSCCSREPISALHLSISLLNCSNSLDKNEKRQQSIVKPNYFECLHVNICRNSDCEDIRWAKFAADQYSKKKGNFLFIPDIYNRFLFVIADPISKVVKNKIYK